MRIVSGCPVYRKRFPHDTSILSILDESQHGFSNSRAINSPPETLDGWREHTIGSCSSQRNTGIWVCCFLFVQNPAIENLRRFAHLHVRSHVVASDAKNSNELLRQFLDYQHLDVVRVVSIFSKIFQAREILSTLSQAGRSFHFLLSILMNSSEK